MKNKKSKLQRSKATPKRGRKSKSANSGAATPATIENNPSVLTPEQMKAKFKAMFVEAAKAAKAPKKLLPTPTPELPTTISVICYRKAYPQEILVQLEPVLRKAGFMWRDIIGLFQKSLEEKGYEIRQHDLSNHQSFGSSEYSFLTITNDREVDWETVPSPPQTQLLRPSEIIAQPDGFLAQGFRLHAERWPGRKPVETLFVPDHGHFHIGKLTECRWDEAERVWVPTGKEKSVAAPWNENSLAEGDASGNSLIAREATLNQPSTKE